MEHALLVGVDLQCKVCGKTYRVENSRALTSKCCSRVCKDKGQEKTITKQCYGCGKPVTRRPSEFGKRCFCSVECLNKWQRSEDSPFHASWTNTQMIETSSERLKKWRSEHEHPRLGVHLSEATKLKIASSHMKPPNPNSIIIHRLSARKCVLKTIQQAKDKLGGVCQLCGTDEILQFAHIYYPVKRVKKCIYESALDALQFEGSVLLLCKKCHNHPEKYLKELIDLRRLK